jgi:hypothetical protein
MKHASVALLLVGACTAGDAGIGKSDCPGTPKLVSVAQTAPFWQGLTRVTFSVPGGAPSAIQVETFNPGLGTWSGYTNNYNSFLEQTDAGDYIAEASISPNDSDKDGSFKVRVRATLAGCPLTGWATTDAFTVSDPYKDTTWTAHTDLGNLYAYFNISPTQGVGTNLGPYTLAAEGVTHTLAFHGDGTLDQTWSFGVNSGHGGDLYAGCKFAIHYVGRWQTTFQPYYRVLISGLVPAVSPLAGSTCANPALANLALAQPGALAPLPPSVIYPNIDYTRLLYTPPGKPQWADSGQFNYLAQVANGLSAVTGDQAQFQGQFSLYNQLSYEKQ